MPRKFTIGREKTCDFPVTDESVSRLHARRFGSRKTEYSPSPTTAPPTWDLAHPIRRDPAPASNQRPVNRRVEDSDSPSSKCERRRQSDRSSEPRSLDAQIVAAAVASAAISSNNLHSVGPAPGRASCRLRLSRAAAFMVAAPPPPPTKSRPKTPPPPPPPPVSAPPPVMAPASVAASSCSSAGLRRPTATASGSCCATAETA